MPCLACADRVLGVLLQGIIHLNLRYAASRVPETPQWRWFSARRRQSTRLPVGISTSRKNDLYVPFHGVLTANKDSSLPQKTGHLEKKETNPRQLSLLPSVSQDCTHAFLQSDVGRVGLGIEPSILLPQDAADGEGGPTQAFKGSPERFGAPRSEHIYSQSWLSSSSKPPPEELCDERAFVDLSPDAVDAIAAEAVTAGPKCMLLPKGGDESERGFHSQTPKRIAQNGGQVNGGLAAATMSSEMGSRIAKRVRYNAEPWQIQKDALEAKFGSNGWNPRKRLSPDALDGIRALNAQFPDKYKTPLLAEQFKVSPEAIRRILKSKWRPSGEEAKKRQSRWEKRGEKIWGKMVELGVKPPKKWREMGVRKSKAEDLRSDKPGRQGWSERGLRKLWNADNIGEEKANHYDWDEETLAERIL